MGKCAFEYIRDYEEWIQSGLFPANIISILRGQLRSYLTSIVILILVVAIHVKNLYG